MKIIYIIAIVIGTFASGLSIYKYYQNKNCKCNKEEEQTGTEQTETE